MTHRTHAAQSTDPIEHAAPCRRTPSALSKAATPATPNRPVWAWGLALGVLGALGLALKLPPSTLSEGYHAFADQRTLGHVPHGSNVWSNLPFAVLGVLLVGQLEGLWGLRRGAQARRGQRFGEQQATPAQPLSAGVLALLALTALGLLATALCSSAYHWQPHDAGLCLDRMGMSIAFAGVLGLAVADRVGTRAGLWLAALLLVAAPWAAWWAWQGENMTPWVVLQSAGLALLLALSVKSGPAQLGVAWWAVLLAYAVAKALELGDHAVWAFSGESVSGHALKHGVAALPVLVAVRRRLKAAQSPRLQVALSTPAAHGQNLGQGRKPARQHDLPQWRPARLNRPNRPVRRAARVRKA